MTPAAPLVAFAPPAGVETELQWPPPRPIPDELREGRHAKKRATGLWFGVFFSAACAAVGVLTAGTHLRFYFLALPYFPYIAALTFVLTLAVLAVDRFRLGPYAYVRDGIPVRARVLDIQLGVAMTHNGVPSAYRYSVMVEYVDPHDGHRKQRLAASPLVELRVKEKTFTPLRVGDEVTALGLPGRFDQTFTLYGFLQLSPQVDFVQRRDQDVRDLRPPVQALKALGLTVAITLLLGAVTVGPSLLPWSFPDRADPWPWAALAVATFVAGSIGLSFLWRREDRKKRERLERENEEARREGRPTEAYAPLVSGIFKAVVYAGGGILPLLFGTLVVVGLNAGLDRTPARFETVSLEEFRHGTTLLVFRDYEVRYERGGTTETHALTVEELATLQVLSPREGVLEWHDGWLGMPWVRTVRPSAKPRAE